MSAAEVELERDRQRQLGRVGRAKVRGGFEDGIVLHAEAIGDGPAEVGAELIAIDRGLRRPAAVGRRLAADGLLERCAGVLEGDRLRRRAGAFFDRRVDLGENEVARVEAARPAAGKRFVRQRVDADRRHVLQLRDAFDGVRVGRRIRPAGQDRRGIFAGDSEHGAAGGFGFGDDQRRPLHGRLFHVQRRPLVAIFLLPFHLRRRQLRRVGVDHLLRRRDRAVEAIQFLFLLRRGQQKLRLRQGDGRLLDVREERAHPVKILLRERVELVIVTLATAHGHAHPGRGDVAHAIAQIFLNVFLCLRPAFPGGQEQAVVAGGDLLLAGGAGHEIAGDLIDGELIERLVAVEGVDAPVAPGPDLARVIAVEADGVAVAHQVHPHDRHALAVARRGEQPIDHLVVRVARLVIDERVDLRRRRREARQVEAEPADQRDAVRLGRRLEAQLAQLVGDEVVDGVADEPGRRRAGGDDRGLRRARQRRPRRRDVGPVALPLRPLFDPALDERDLLGGQMLVRVLVRHAEVGVVRGDPHVHHAVVRLAGNDGEGIVLGGEQTVFRVQPQFRLAAVLVRTVTAVAVVREDRADVAVEIDFSQGRWGRSGRLWSCSFGANRIARAGPQRDHHSRHKKKDDDSS